MLISLSPVPEQRILSKGELEFERITQTKKRMADEFEHRKTSNREVAEAVSSGKVEEYIDNIVPISDEHTYPSIPSEDRVQTHLVDYCGICTTVLYSYKWKECGNGLCAQIICSKCWVQRTDFSRDVCMKCAREPGEMIKYE